MKLKALYKTLARPAKKIKSNSELELKSLNLHVVEEPEDKITTHIEVKSNGCWFWLGAKDKYGYGQIRIEGKLLKTHRFAYEVYNGTFDKKLHVCHHCDQPSCINPDHLFLGTVKDNAEDRAKKNRGATTTKRLSLEQRSRIIESLQTGRSRREVAADFGVHERTVGRVKARYEATRHPTMGTFNNPP